MLRALKRGAQEKHHLEHRRFPMNIRKHFCDVRLTKHMQRLCRQVVGSQSDRSEGTFWDHSVQPPAKAVSLEWVTQESIQAGFRYLQRRRCLRNLSGSLFYRVSLLRSCWKLPGHGCRQPAVDVPAWGGIEPADLQWSLPTSNFMQLNWIGPLGYARCSCLNIFEKYTVLETWQ